MSVNAADYYYSRQDFKQALELYSLANESRNIIKIAELKFLLSGRAAARTFLLNYLEKNKEISSEYKIQITDRLSSLLESFVTDEGQSEYYRALTKIRHRDWVSAESFLEGAANKEDGNSLVLHLKSLCEKELKKMKEYTNTLAVLHGLNPYNADVKEKLSEAYYSTGAYSKFILLFAGGPLSTNSYGNLLKVISKFESEKISDTDLDELEVLSEDYPIASFYLGRELYKNRDDRMEAVLILKQFVSKNTDYLTDGWDPLKVSEKVIESKKILAEYSSSLK